MQSLISTALPCWVIGHRGAAAVCPENTLSSLLTARDSGACMIEFDVQQSTDGELFVFHDDTLERLCDDPSPVALLPWETLATKTVGRWQNQALRIPRLAEVFTTLQRSLFYNVELKTDTVAYPGIEARLVELIRACGLSERVLVSSFRHESLRRVRENDTNLSLGLLLSREQARLLGSPEAVVARAREFSCFSVHPYFRLLRQWPTLVETCHAANLRVFPWTVDEPQDWRFLVNDVHVDGIITNDPGRLYAWLLTQPGY
jgi:glycerophosphoryl diester phosphodiesterase